MFPKYWLSIPDDHLKLHSLQLAHFWMAGRRHNLQHTPPQWHILENLLTLQIDTVATAYHWYQPWLVHEQTVKWPQLPFPWVLEGYHINWSSTDQSTLFTLIGIVVEGYHINWSSTDQSTLFTLIGIVVEGYHINWSSIDQSTLLFTLIGIFIWPLQNISCFKKKKIN